MVLINDSLRALLVRVRSLLGGRDWVYLLTLLVPLVVYDLTLKAIRVHTQEEHASLLGSLGLIRSDLLFNLGYALFWIGLFALARRGLARWLVVVLFHGVTVVVIAITTCAHFYFEETGSTLDLNIIVYSLTTLGEVNDVIASVTSPAIWALAAAALCYVVLGPWLVTWLVRRWRRWRNRRELT
jgi:lipoteichoic acid synthase